MATTKIWKIKTRFDNVIDYITNKDKTDNKNNETNNMKNDKILFFIYNS